MAAPTTTRVFHGALIAPTPSVIGGFFIGRSREGGVYCDDELEGFDLLRLHLLRAVQVRQRLEGAEAAKAEALDHVGHGVLLVDARGLVLHANRAASAILRSGVGLRTTPDALACEHPDDTSRLRRLLGQASTGGSGGTGGLLVVRRRAGLRPLSVLIAPLRGEHPGLPTPPATAIVLVADPDRAEAAPADHLRQLYGLTRAECRVALALPGAGRLADIADGLGLSLSTVRTLLQRAFEKTDTHRQAELVRLLIAHRSPAGWA